MSANNIITTHVIINRDTHAMLNDFLQKLKSLHNQQCYNILNNLIYYQKLISVDVTYATVSGEVYKSAHQHYNILFNAELVDDVARAIYVKDICDYEEFCTITWKMKSLKSAFVKCIANSFPVTASAFHQIYTEDVTGHSNAVPNRDGVDINGMFI